MCGDPRHMELARENASGDPFHEAFPPLQGPVLEEFMKLRPVGSEALSGDE